MGQLFWCLSESRLQGTAALQVEDEYRGLTTWSASGPLGGEKRDESFLCGRLGDPALPWPVSGCPIFHPSNIPFFHVAESMLHCDPANALARRIAILPDDPSLAAFNKSNQMAHLSHLPKTFIHLFHRLLCIEVRSIQNAVRFLK